ncbi:hypothetical protein ACFOGI_00620 [Virgibacillus xinjiangensis]|uniref:Uncharacterized protein n=1 Tax=Virgibacillus xinjiangensis TaxID=393090 RepID=A0ABV7CRA0_9BACI
MSRKSAGEQVYQQEAAVIGSSAELSAVGGRNRQQRAVISSRRP